MDLIERLFHIAPDGGNGMTELLLLGVLLAAPFAARRIRQHLTRRAARRSRPVA